MENKSEIPLQIFQLIIALLFYLGLSALTFMIFSTALDTKNKSNLFNLIMLALSFGLTIGIGNLVDLLFPKRIRRTIFIPLIVVLLPAFCFFIYMTLYQSQSFEGYGYNYALIFYWLLSVVLFFASWFLVVSRLQDVNASEGMILLFLIPVANLILITALCFIAGTVGANQYGEDPRQKGLPQSPK